MRSRSRIDGLRAAAAALLWSVAATAGADSAAVAGIAGAPGRLAPDDSAPVLHLEAFVNGASSGLIVDCAWRDGAWHLPLSHLGALGLRTDDLRPDPAGWVALDGVSGLAARYEAKTQRLDLTVIAARRNLTVLRRASASRPGDEATGLLFNYDALGEGGSGPRAFRALTEQRLFGGLGVLANTGTWTATGGHSRYLRLDTAWTHADPATLRALTAGDFVTRSLAWSRSVRIGGVQLARNFALRPDLVTWPVAGFDGEAAVPSSVDMYVNEVRQLAGDLPAGPFRIEAPPALNGAGQVTLRVRDALGRETVQTLDLYVVPQLLTPGLTDYSLEFGAMREDYGLRSDRYRGDLVGSGSLRRGVTERLTLEAHAEGSSGLALGGVGLLWQPGRFGRINAALALSDAKVEDGWDAGEKWSAGYQYVAPAFNVTLDWQQATRGFSDLPALVGSPPPRRIWRAFAGVQLRPETHLTSGYVETEAARREDDSRVASMGLRQSLGPRQSLYLTAFRDLARDDGGGVYLGWSVALGDGIQLHSEYASDEDRAGFTAASRAPNGEGWEWLVRGSAADDTRWQAASRYTGGYGALSADVARDGDRERWQLGARGAVVLADARLVAGRYVQDEFALVSTDGLAGVPVLHENRPVGRTNAGGMLLVPNVNAYQPNAVAIDPLAIPFGYRVDRAERNATPRLAAGALVRFPMERPRSAVLTLVDGAGLPLPVGSRVERAGGGAAAIVGYDGIVYLEGLGDSNRLRVATAAGSCVAEFTLAPDAEAEVDLGRVSCR